MVNDVIKMNQAAAETFPHKINIVSLHSMDTKIGSVVCRHFLSKHTLPTVKAGE